MARLCSWLSGFNGYHNPKHYNNHCTYFSLHSKETMKQTHDQKLEKIKAWLLEHPFLNMAGVCREAGTHHGNFMGWLRGTAQKKPSEQTVASIIPILKQYGYR